MIATVLPVVALLGVIGSGLMAGVFFAFSTAVMPGLRLLRPAAGIEAMQQLNRVIQNPLFLLVFMGTGLLCLLLVIGAPITGGPGTAWIVIGGLLYLVGSIGLTFVVNVPMNNRLDAANPLTDEGAAIWADHLSRWTAWNHVRALACTAAVAALTLGVMAP
ncbi:anthrone oxygenase family protein [Pseudonocardia sp. DLS-67]